MTRPPPQLHVQVISLTAPYRFHCDKLKNNIHELVRDPLISYLLSTCQKHRNPEKKQNEEREHPSKMIIESQSDKQIETKKQTKNVTPKEKEFKDIICQALRT